MRLWNVGFSLSLVLLMSLQQFMVVDMHNELTLVACLYYLQISWIVERFIIFLLKSFCSETCRTPRQWPLEQGSSWQTGFYPGSNLWVLLICSILLIYNFVNIFYAYNSCVDLGHWCSTSRQAQCLQGLNFL